jgi:hypothetical protein
MNMRYLSDEELEDMLDDDTLTPEEAKAIENLLALRQSNKSNPTHEQRQENEDE